MGVRNDDGQPLTPTLAVLTILKGMIGSGILALPAVFRKVNLAVAVPGYIAVTCICYFSIWRMLQCKELVLRSSRYTDEAREQKLRMEKGDGSDQSDDQDMDRSDGEASHGVGAKRNDHGLGPLAFVASQVLGCPGCWLAGVGVVFSQLGLLMCYFKVICETLESPSLLGAYVSPLALRGLIVGIALGLILLRDMSSIAKVGAGALAIYGYMLFALYRWGSAELAEHGPRGQWLPVLWDGFGTWLGTSMFAQAGIVVSQMVYDAMRLATVSEFRPVLATSFAITGIVCTFVGGFGYWCFGDSIQDVFYLSFPGGSADVRISEALLSIVLLLSIPVQAFPIVYFLDYTFDALHRGCSLRSLVLRWLIVAISALVGLRTKNLLCITGYSGSLGMGLISFLLPPMCHMKIRDFQLSPIDWLLDILLLLVGFVTIYEGVSSISC